MSEDQSPYFTDNDPDAITPENLERAGWVLYSRLPSYDDKWERWDRAINHIILSVEVDTLGAMCWLAVGVPSGMKTTLPHIHTMTQLKTLWTLLSGEGLNNE